MAILFPLRGAVLEPSIDIGTTKAPIAARQLDTPQAFFLRVLRDGDWVYFEHFGDLVSRKNLRLVRLDRKRARYGGLHDCRDLLGGEQRHDGHDALFL